MSHYIDNEKSITHYGVLGMKWGIRRYQPYSYTGGGSGKEVGEAARKSKATAAKEKIKSSIKTYKNKRKMAKVRKAKIDKAKREAEEKIRKANAEKEIADLKKRITKDAPTLNRNQELARKLFSNDEYDKIKNRLQSEQQVYELAQKKNDRARQTVENILKYSSTGVKIYNAINAWDKILGDDKQQSSKPNTNNKTQKQTDNPKKETSNKSFNFKEAFWQYKSAKKAAEWNDWFEDVIRNVEYVEPQLLLEDKKKR